MRWLRNLNAEQRQAVQIVEGPLLVLAGAGSGKTRVITHRIAHMLDLGIEAENILAVTFTNKAAGEMRERLAQMVGHDRAAEVTLSTFHSLGLQMLKREAARGKRRTRFTIFDTGDQLGCLKEIIRRLHLDRSFDLGSILGRISSYKNAFLAPDALPDSDDPYDEAAAILYPRYLELLEAYAALDFDDLVCKPTAMMERSAACKKRWADRFRYVLVDEYQDTNAAQLRMLKAIAGGHRNICVVGDDDQSIYGWRGAEVKNILQFDRDFKGAEVVYLMRNYRSVGSVLELANAVIAENDDRHEKVLTCTREPGRAVRMVVAPDGDAEANWAATTIAAAIKEGRYGAHDVAILYRSNILSRQLELSLREHGVPYRVLGGQALFDRKEVKDLSAYLKLCENPADEISLRRAINTPARGVGPKTVAKLAAWAEANNAPLYKALSNAETILGPSDRALSPIKGFVELLHRNRKRLRQGRDLGGAGKALVDEIGFRREIERTSTSSKIFDRRWGSISALLAGLSTYASRADKPTLGEYLHKIALVNADDDLSDGPLDRVTLCTLHGAKGLEFPLVILVGLEEGILPHDRTINPQQNDHVSSEIAEERRLCYVGITRAKDELILMRASERTIRGRPQLRCPSRFIEGPAKARLVVEDLSAPPKVEDVKSMLADLRAKWAAAE